MTLRVQREIADIKNMLLQMSSLVEEAVRSSLLSIQRKDIELASQVIRRDKDIDALEMKIDDRIINSLALQQPMAGDLRFLLSATQIAAQLERVGDHAVNIAEQAQNLMEETSTISPSSIRLREMGTLAINMLGDSINAFVYRDSALANEVRISDKNVDDLYEYVTEEEINLMESSPHDVKPGVYHIILALNLERIADLATNIAEDVIFLTEGRIVRHDEGLKPKEEELLKKVEHMEKEAPCEKITKVMEPLECLEDHSNYVHQCLEQAHLAVMAYCENRKDEFKAYTEKVIELEKASDRIKRNVRAHVPRGIIMPIDKFELFQLLNEQDDVANTAEDITDWLTYTDIDVPAQLKEDYDRLLKKCLEISEAMPKIIHSARTYFQTGDEDVRALIKDRIRKLRDKETEADTIEHEIKKEIFDTYKETFPIYFLVRLTELLGRSADHAVGAVDVLRSMIAR